MKLRWNPHQWLTSVGTKIIFPYVLLTLVVAGIGAYVVTNLVAGSLQERFNNQLLDAGRIVSETIVVYEEQRLAVLRHVVRTQGVPQAVAEGDKTKLAALVPQIILNSDIDSLILLNQAGEIMYGWQRFADGELSEISLQADWASDEDVQLALAGARDEVGDKRVILTYTPRGYLLYAVSPIYLSERSVGAALVGTNVNKMVAGLTENAVAKVTLYDEYGDVVATSLGQAADSNLTASVDPNVSAVLAALHQSPDDVQRTIAKADNEVPVEHIELFGQDYQLVFGEWRLRNKSLGLFSVALPSNFIVSTAVTSRNFLSSLFALATMFMFCMGFIIARRIIQPLHRLVQISTAVSHGHLDEQTGIQRHDEIGQLAEAFDKMTENLAERNRQLVEQASKLETVLHSIHDGIIMVDIDNNIMTANPSAATLLRLNEDSLCTNAHPEPCTDALPIEALKELLPGDKSQRYEIGSRVFSAQALGAVAPDKADLGRVIVIRDVTREAEAEQLRDSFITSVSHELRTPLTSIKGYIELLLMSSNKDLEGSQLQFLEKVRSNTDKLAAHVNKLIEISEVQDGTLSVHPRPEQLAPIVAEAVSRWQEPMAANQVVFTFENEIEDLPVEVDADRLTWAMDNLLDNACLYASPHGEVRVKVGQNGNQVFFEVVDNGIGVSIADQPYLFTPFFRAHNEQIFDIPGIGLGLYITRYIVEAHNGRVYAQSTLGEGSTFGFALPVGQNLKLKAVYELSTSG